ncbi:hypothetical protein Ciccas_005924 [Cichlidogyrus casuarinus]|uniref:Uncharacterized protein n=1 Tax=Cichlidogyrus casuarinus TaxID=1844966 RepID=A0ABD2Q890_9PLAT
MIIFVKTLAGSISRLNVSPHETVYSLKMRIYYLRASSSDLAVSSQNLYLRSELLSNDRASLSQLGISQGDVLLLGVNMQTGKIDPNFLPQEEGHLAAKHYQFDSEIGLVPGTLFFVPLTVDEPDDEDCVTVRISTKWALGLVTADGYVQINPLDDKCSRFVSKSMLEQNFDGDDTLEESIHSREQFQKLLNTRQQKNNTCNLNTEIEHLSFSAPASLEMRAPSKKQTPGREQRTDQQEQQHKPNRPPLPKAKQVDRCGQCSKRLRLTNCFSCRCEKIFCTLHHHPEDHSCQFDFKAKPQPREPSREEMREALAKFLSSKAKDCVTGCRPIASSSRVEISSEARFNKADKKR